jgi:hypothetical protein
VGQNYFAICGDAVMAGCPPDVRAVAGIKRVLRGELPVFTLDYAGQGSAVERWFMLTPSSSRSRSLPTRSDTGSAPPSTGRGLSEG